MRNDKQDEQGYDVIIVVGPDDRELSREQGLTLSDAETAASLHNLGSDYSTAVVEPSMVPVKSA